jgi:hypothetical protein
MLRRVSTSARSLVFCYTQRTTNKFCIVSVHTEIGWGVEWINLAQDRGCWRAVVHAVMNLLVLVPRS